MRTWVKFCGCTSLDDVALAAQAGADAFGMIFAPSARQITWEAAESIALHLPEFDLEAVAVVVDPTQGELTEINELFPHARLQFSGSEPADLVSVYAERSIKAIHIDGSEDPDDITSACRLYPRARILFDTKTEGLAGGSGTPFPWRSVAAVAAEREVVIAGGLTSENVGKCVADLRPHGVDVRSGVESDGRKDAGKMREFVRVVREAAGDDA
jgi:phosphoribosylanthranilate isomerase